MKELTIEAVLPNVSVLTDFIDGELEAIGCPLKAQRQIDVAIDEVFSNISQYAYPSGTGSATVRFEYDEQARQVVISFFDRGTPYNPLENTDPDVTLPASERAIGGLGIFLVKKTMDNVAYRYQDGMNVFSLFKKV